MSSLKQFSLLELAAMDDGRIAVAFDQAIRRAAVDCDDRPGDDRARKVLLEIEFTPTCDESGLCESVQSQIQIKDTLPSRKSRKFDLGIRKGGMFVFSPASLANHRQGSLPLDEDS